MFSFDVQAKKDDILEDKNKPKTKKKSNELLTKYQSKIKLINGLSRALRERDLGSVADRRRLLLGAAFLAEFERRKYDLAMTKFQTEANIEDFSKLLNFDSMGLATDVEEKIIKASEKEIDKIRKMSLQKLPDPKGKDDHGFKVKDYIEAESKLVDDFLTKYAKEINLDAPHLIPHATLMELIDAQQKLTSLITAKKGKASQQDVVGFIK